MLQETVARVQALPECVAPLVVINSDHRFIVAEQIKELGVAPAAMILEPLGRNTAPAAAVAALQLQRQDADAIMMVLPSDHAIRDAAGFRSAALAAARLAERGMLVTFGVTPSEPNTGYGYIELGEVLAHEPGAFRIRRFVEKPDLAKARSYVESGRYRWNSGIFVFSARRFLEELKRFAPAILAAAEKALAAAVRDLDFLRLERAAFEAAPSLSIDYAVMEHTEAGAVVPGDIGWSDVGSWSALWDIGSKDASGNVVRGDAYLHDVKRSYLWGQSRLLVGLGLQDLIIVETDDAVLIAERARAQEVKDIVAWLDQQGRSEHVTHTRVYRPWGYYESIDQGRGFQVKRLMVKPHQALSLQLHHKRAEHWVVVSGRARVTRGEAVYEVAANESTFIPLGTKHRLENATDDPLYLIEVQSGSYLGEDDIVRFDDQYGRA
jgi:mannose-1-phosphate guanylyltransferase/mannose-6-phosphate isomerase